MKLFFFTGTTCLKSSMQTSEMPVCDNAYNTGVIFLFFSNFPQFFVILEGPGFPMAKKVAGAVVQYM